jgi:hypothetical protein
MGSLFLRPTSCSSCDAGHPQHPRKKTLTCLYTAPPKAKGQKMALGMFLQDTCTQFNDPFSVCEETEGDLIYFIALGSWADEMEDVSMPSE